MTPTQPRPLCLLDVDGVLNLFGLLGLPDDQLAPNIVKGSYIQEQGYWSPTYHLRWYDNLPDIVAKLDKVFDLVWATTWENEANDFWLPKMGLTQPLPVIAMNHRPRDRQPYIGCCHKTPSVQYWLENRCGPDTVVNGVWIDDDAHQMSDGELLPNGFRVVTTNPSVGLTHEIADNLCEEFTNLFQ